MKSNAMRIVSLLCVLALSLGLVGVLSVAAEESAASAQEISLYDQILARDGYLEGIWFPWFNHDNLGHGLTSNEVMVEYVGDMWSTVGLDEYGVDNIYREIYNLKALGFNLLGYEGSIYGEGVIFDQHGDVIGIKEEYLHNVRRFLDICREVGMPVLWTVCCHSTSVNDYYEYGKMVWDIVCRCYADNTVADHYAQRFVAPLCEVLAEYPDVVAMVASTSEAENEINDSEIGDHFEGRELYGVNQEDMLYFVNAVTETVKEMLPGIPRTICCQFEDMSVYGDTDFDLFGDQNYNYAGNSTKIDSFRVSAPMFVSEFGLGFEKKYDDATFTKLQLTFRNNFRRDGYKGWVMWCWSTDRDQPGSTFSFMKYGAKGVTDFRSTAYELHYYINEYRAEHRGETVVLDTPVLFCNIGDGRVEWIASRQATSMDLLRSVDGGETWERLLDNVTPDDYVTDGKGVYMDTSAPAADTMYQVVVRDDAGHTATSAPSNTPKTADSFGDVYAGAAAPAFDWGDFPFAIPTVSVQAPLKLISTGLVMNRPVTPAVNLIEDGSFESDTGTWAVDTFLGDTVSVVTDATAPEGDKSLYFDTSSRETGEWRIVWVDVTPNTDYIFSTWIKGAYLSEDNRGYATVGVVDPATQRYIPYDHKKPFYTQSKQLVPTAWDDAWHLRSISFNSGDRERVGVALYGCGTRMWVDGMALYESSRGVKYVSENMKGVVGFGYGAEYGGCDDADSVTENIRMDDVTSDYWQSGSGWKNGFMRMVDNAYEYGTSLQYTASADPRGLYYIKWVPVEAHTNYTFSVDMKVLESGGGRLMLMNGKKSNRTSFVEFDFNGEDYGYDWFSLMLDFNTDTFTTIGIAVMDAGGVALLDNIRLFKTEDGKDVEDEYLEDKQGWVEDDEGWLYYENGRKARSKWIKWNGAWYYLDADGYMVSNKWVKDSSGWCYLNASGSMVKNAWVKDNGKWYFLDANGYMVTNAWKKDSKGWVYVGKDGAMLTNAWCKDSQGWCYVGAD
ncbi:MAG: hypothetical protein IKU51_06295, partial [Clostridia bacterium]|nr:hypothetical protein [Clostridia bacterium]